MLISTNLLISPHYLKLGRQCSLRICEGIKGKKFIYASHYHNRLSTKISNRKPLDQNRQRSKWPNSYLLSISLMWVWRENRKKWLHHYVKNLEKFLRKRRKLIKILRKRKKNLFRPKFLPENRTHCATSKPAFADCTCNTRTSRRLPSSRTTPTCRPLPLRDTTMQVCIRKLTETSLTGTWQLHVVTRGFRVSLTQQPQTGEASKNRLIRAILQVVWRASQRRAIRATWWTRRSTTRRTTSSGTVSKRGSTSNRSWSAQPNPGRRPPHSSPPNFVLVRFVNVAQRCIFSFSSS